MFFLSFDMDHLAKIHRRRWKERFKINKVAKFPSEMFKTNAEDMQPQRRKILYTLVKFRDFAELYLRSLVTCHFQTWQVY